MDIGVVLGKFTLMFSLAPEFVRRVYNKNYIPNDINRQNIDFTLHSKISETDWKKLLVKENCFGYDKNTRKINN